MRTGDIRVNEQPGLSAFHNIWVRLHNVYERQVRRRLPEGTSSFIIFQVHCRHLSVHQCILSCMEYSAHTHRHSHIRIACTRSQCTLCMNHNYYADHKRHACACTGDNMVTVWQSFFCSHGLHMADDSRSILKLFTCGRT